MINTLEINKDSISDSCNRIAEILSKTKSDNKEIQSTILLVEEISLLLFKHNAPDNITIKIRSRLGSISVCMEYGGEEYNPLEIFNEWKECDEYTDIQRRIICAYQKRLTYLRKNRKNMIYIQVHEQSKKELYLTLAAMMAGLIAGQLLKMFVPQGFTSALDINVLSTIKTLFLNALKMMIAPVVFFSIASSVSNLTNASEVGKMAVKIIGLYMVTTCIAILVGFGISQVCFLGDLNVNTESFGEVYTSTQTFNISLKDMIVGIIPTNIVDPIAKADMLQIMFISIMVGISASILGDKVKLIQDLITAGNNLSLQIVKLIMKFIPIVSFCSMTSMMINLGTSSLMAIIRLTIGFIASILTMIIVYTIMFRVFVKMPVGPFRKKVLSYMVTPFSMASSNAAIPSSIEFCEKQLGVDSRLASFSIPMGAVINMDGSCVYLVLCTCMFLKIYGISLSPALIITIAVTTFILSIGAPGVTGSGFICLSTILASLGLPIACIGMVVGIDAFYSMCRAASNVTGDIAVSTIVAKSENMFDKDIYMKE